MSWRDNLRPGSFRGAAFQTVSHEGEGGRRGELHEFPERDTPYFEDLGRRGRRWSVEAVIFGKDYMAGRDALIAACDQKDSATLVHPYLGELRAVCLNYRFRESTEEGGAAFFTLDFVDPGALEAAAVGEDTATQSTDLADTVQAQAPAQFANRFSTSGMPAFVEGEAAGLVRNLAFVASIAGTALGGGGAALRAYETGLSQLPGGATSLVRSPLSLGHAVVGLMIAVAGLSASPIARIRALRQMIASTRALPGVRGTTPARIRQRSNQDALQALVTVAAASEAVRAASNARFASYDEAVALRDALADDLDQAALDRADQGDDNAARQLDDLRLAMVRDITARGGSLERLYGFTPSQTQPALLIAQQLYGDPAIVAERADELVERNHVAHPGFVPGGRELSVRTLSTGQVDG